MDLNGNLNFDHNNQREIGNRLFALRLIELLTAAATKLAIIIAIAWIANAAWQRHDSQTKQEITYERAR